MGCCVCLTISFYLVKVCSVVRHEDTVNRPTQTVGLRIDGEFLSLFISKWTRTIL